MIANVVYFLVMGVCVYSPKIIPECYYRAASPSSEHAFTFHTDNPWPSAALHGKTDNPIFRCISL